MPYCYIQINCERQECAPESAGGELLLRHGVEIHALVWRLPDDVTGGHSWPGRCALLTAASKDGAASKAGISSAASLGKRLESEHEGALLSDIPMESARKAKSEREVRFMSLHHLSAHSFTV
jgi:hypothetical protein